MSRVVNSYKNKDTRDVAGIMHMNNNRDNNSIASKEEKENDESIAKLYEENKINKSMLIKYMERKQKTACRGKIHLLVLLSSPIWIYYMLCLSKTTKAKIFTLVAMSCILFNAFASFLYHQFEWTPKSFFLLEKMDHIGIFLMISYSTIPVPALLFNPVKLSIYIGLQLLMVLFGSFFICFSTFSSGSRALRTSVFVFAGFLHALFIKDLVTFLNLDEFVFLIMLAVFYIIGAVIYSRKKPNLISGFLEFHDIFHICCLGSSICTFALNASVLKRKT
ncbi:hemolysin III, putative [Hepatocystis sp. ex Piliocolobus tephrosceles]|nr:hemolysin III, putative [Hepatocystis sp. ex Piliocolobus tephrosceles]